MAKLDETHPLLPSGTWEGFYTYQLGPDADKHPMKNTITFRKGKMSGGGSDDVSTYSWKGTYYLDGLICKMDKRYSSHKVAYSGEIDENGIWGTWTLKNISGGFHIWPVDKMEKGQKVAKAVKKKKISKTAPKKA